MTTVLWLNKETNKVDNASLDDRPISEITLPNTHLALDKDNTPSIVYGLNDDNTEIIEHELIGQGGIGFTWDGTKLIGSKPIIEPGV
jgi:hypothetical protein